jgi:putative SOS response-associated peptidase YedK
MQQFHKPGDEKRTPVVLAASQFRHWLAADTAQAAEMMHWRDMPALHARSSIPSGEIAWTR